MENKVDIVQYFHTPKSIEFLQNMDIPIKICILSKDLMIETENGEKTYKEGTVFVKRNDGTIYITSNCHEVQRILTLSNE